MLSNGVFSCYLSLRQRLGSASQQRLQGLKYLRQPQVQSEESAKITVVPHELHLIIQILHDIELMKRPTMLNANEFVHEAFIR